MQAAQKASKILHSLVIGARFDVMLQVKWSSLPWNFRARAVNKPRAKSISPNDDMGIGRCWNWNTRSFRRFVGIHRPDTVIAHKIESAGAGGDAILRSHSGKKVTGITIQTRWKTL
jgi:hypothetical protein